MSASTNVKYAFDPALPSPGEDYDKFEERLLNAGSAQTDDRGYSLAVATSLASMKARPEALLFLLARRRKYKRPQ